MRLGILTGGGDCPGLNAVIRAAVMRTVRTYEGHMLGFEDGWLGLLGNRVRELDLNAVTGILPRGGTMLGTLRTDPYHPGGGADAVVAPEQPVSIEEVCDLVRRRHARGRDFSIIVVAEGARFKPDPDGRATETPTRLDPSGRVQYGGVGAVLAGEIERRLGIETRTVTLGYVQRGRTPTAFDRLLGTRMGIAAVDLAAAGRFGRMVNLEGSSVRSVELSVVRQGPRPVDPELYEVARVFFG